MNQPTAAVESLPAPHQPPSLDTCWMAWCTAASAGLPDCPCLSAATVSSIVSANGISSALIAGTTYPAFSAGATYGPDYGVQCGPHDHSKPPFCVRQSLSGHADTYIRDFCADAFCWVDQANCGQSDVVASAYFAGAPLYYSYATCNATDSFTGAYRAPPPSPPISPPPGEQSWLPNQQALIIFISCIALAALSACANHVLERAAHARASSCARHVHPRVHRARGAERVRVGATHRAPLAVPIPCPCCCTVEISPHGVRAAGARAPSCGGSARAARSCRRGSSTSRRARTPSSSSSINGCAPLSLPLDHLLIAAGWHTDYMPTTS